MKQVKVVTSAEELSRAIAEEVPHIRVEGRIEGSPSITLPAGTTLTGGTLVFTGRGVRLTADNTLEDVTIETLPHEVALLNDTTLTDAGTIVLRDVTTTGQILLLADHALQRIRVEASGIHVREADMRGRVDQQHAYGVDVIPGAVTLWNRQAAESSEFTATLDGVSVGGETTAVRGSGIFLAGDADREGNATGGKVVADLLRTGEVFVDGGIPLGTPDKITGGVFVSSGAEVQRVENVGRTTTHGPNDMVLDNWGVVEEWVVEGHVTSTGPSGIGFVNFGAITTLEVHAPIITTGSGARGFNLYDGSLDTATFTSITTTGDGAIGIQLSEPIQVLRVSGDIETQGGEGLSLVKGVQTQLQAVALSLKSGCQIGELAVGGVLRTRGAKVTTLEVADGAAIKQLQLGGIEALGDGSEAAKIEGSVPELP